MSIPVLYLLSASTVRKVAAEVLQLECRNPKTSNQLRTLYA
jgi:hypothetical protein